MHKFHVRRADVQDLQVRPVLQGCGVCFCPRRRAGLAGRAGAHGSVLQPADSRPPPIASTPAHAHAPLRPPAAGQGVAQRSDDGKVLRAAGLVRPGGTHSEVPGEEAGAAVCGWAGPLGLALCLLLPLQLPASHAVCSAPRLQAAAQPPMLSCRRPPTPSQSRVLHGVRPEILALSEIPFVKAYTARLLYRAGLRCVCTPCAAQRPLACRSRPRLQRADWPCSAPVQDARGCGGGGECRPDCVHPVAEPVSRACLPRCALACRQNPPSVLPPTLPAALAFRAMLACSQ